MVDAATGEDMTRLILAQIVLEDAKTPDSVFPLDVLRQMIVASGRATQENALRYMKAMMDMYQNAYRAMPSPMNPFEFLPGRGQNRAKEATPADPDPMALRQTGRPTTAGHESPKCTSCGGGSKSWKRLLAGRKPQKARRAKQNLAASLDAVRQNH